MSQQQMIEHIFPTVDMTLVGETIHKMHEQVATHGQRVHICRADCEDICVMISKKELESLEQAIAILADTEEFNGMCENLRTLLKSAGVVYAPQAFEESATQNTHPV